MTMPCGRIRHWATGLQRRRCSSGRPRQLWGALGRPSRRGWCRPMCSTNFQTGSVPGGWPASARRKATTAHPSRTASSAPTSATKPARAPDRPDQFPGGASARRQHFRRRIVANRAIQPRSRSNPFYQNVWTCFTTNFQRAKPWHVQQRRHLDPDGPPRAGRPRRAAQGQQRPQHGNRPPLRSRDAAGRLGQSGPPRLIV